ncbi:MAG: bifunctional glutamate N-acetyltransferase/amino-acid acetyltransferase ArgJ [Proteobacteria bacterium]|nr:bifunctional glutamate N-acetyltransferase/amino-acid acetyltransferase ArgJ [Pseudomonadota bacterium]
MIIDGFTYSAVSAGIRKKDRLDLGLIYCENPAVAGAVFTTSLVKAAPVLLGMEMIAAGKIQAILVNSGIANACTGAAGMDAALKSAKLAAAALDIDEGLVQVSSTGVIGEQLPVETIGGAMDELVKGLSPLAYDQVARAIMTTDTVPKTANRVCLVGGSEVKLFGIAKGAGMIMPDMATMLCFVMTDADIAAPVLQAHLSMAVKQSFNRITIDGDTSTNDTVLAMSSCRAGNPEINSLDTEESRIIGETLTDLLKDLALQIVSDGEGSTKLVTIRVEGARSEDEAELAARTIANSALVKTAFFGEDANWGRIIAALGRSGIDFDPDKVSIAFDDVLMVRDGLGLGVDVEAEATRILQQKIFSVTVDLKIGPAAGEVYTCDLSIDYVKINADYRT